MLPDYLKADPMAKELHRCGLALEVIGEMIERAAMLEASGVSRQEAEALVSGGESYSP